MALTEEWKHRLTRWESALWDSVYIPVGRIDLSGFTTSTRLTFDQASQEAFHPMPTGSRWGAMWEYGWFKTSLTLPDTVRGQQIVARLQPGGESLVWINSRVQSSIGWGHKEFTLTRCAKGGEEFVFLIEAYAGHGVPTDGKGVLLPGQVWMPDPGPAQATVGESTYGVWREDVYQLALDFTTLLQLSRSIDPLSQRASQIDEALMQSTRVIDLELPEPEMLESVRAGKALLKPLLECHNGPSMPVMHAFGHAHLDVAWLWPLAETRRKIARTVANQLALMDEYPQYRFLQSQPELYQMLKEDYPELYERFKSAVKSGQVIADGGMWLEADTNITGGESLIRQVLHGKRFFRDEFGVDSRVLWLPDVFGYSGALPQILAGCQMDGFATHKITWAYNGGDPFPYNLFWWQGIDGSAIPAHIFSDYNSQTTPAAILERWNTRLQKNGVPIMMLCFGWGDGGGGPARDHLEFLRRAEDLEGLPRVKISSPAEFFTELKQLGLPRERYVGELYFQAHRGTYTSQARTKQLNRRAEIALREAEFWGSAAQALGKMDFSSQNLDTAWKNLLLHQFHDILPGSSIHAVYEETETALADVVEQGYKTAYNAAKSLAAPGNGVTVFNSLPWPRRALVDLRAGPIEVDLPACGWTTVELEQPANFDQHAAWATASTLENEYIRAEFNPRGEITCLLDKTTGRIVLTAPGNQFQMFKDVPDSFDAWDIDSMTESVPVTLDEPVSIEIINPGPLAAELRLTRMLHHSTLIQVIRLRRSSRRLDFITSVDWQETHKLLKVAFPTAIHSDEALHEIQFGHVRRPTHRSRPYDADRFEVSQHKWSALAETSRGAAILNDCKYGISTDGGTLKLSLLRSPAAPDPLADRGEQSFTYSFYFWNGSLADSGLIEQAYDLNIPPLVLEGTRGEGWLFKLDAPGIVLETVKPAEDSSGDVILRLYEALHTAARAVLQVNLPVLSVWQTDMLEENPVSLEFTERNLVLDFRPFEIKTIRLSMR